MDYDNFDPRQENDLDDMNDGLYDYKMFDKGYYKLSRKTTVHGKNYPRTKKANIEIFASGQNGNHIRDAITGQYTEYKVGKIDDESLFFKVSIATGEIQKANRLFFFQTPNEYEKRFNSILSTQIKEDWLIRRDKARIAKKIQED
jgi:hypothetical protein